MTTQTVILKIKDRTALSTIEKIISATGGYTIESENGIPRDLLIFEITDRDTEDQFAFIRGMMLSGKAGHVFLVSGVTDPDVLIRVLKIGPAEFFPLPLNPDDVRNALVKFRATPSRTDTAQISGPAREGTIIHVFGSKGGVGTTTVAVNLARTLLEPRMGQTVALVDMNLLFGDIPIFLNMESPLFDWAEVARNISRLDSNFLMGILYKHPSGLNILPSPSGILESASSGPDVIAKLLGLMKSMFDYVIVDGGQDLGDTWRSITKLADRVFIVTLLNLPCLINIKRLRDTFARLGYPADDRVSIVANRVNRKSGNISVENAERTTKKKIAWTIPNDFQNTMDAINMGKALQELAPGSEVNRHIARMASFFQKSFVQKQETGEEQKKKRGLFGVFS